MNALEHALKKARQTKPVCAVTRRGTGRGYESREPISILAHPDLVVLADEIERLHRDRCNRQSNADRYFAALMNMAAATGRSVNEFMPPPRSGLDTNGDGS